MYKIHEKAGTKSRMSVSQAKTSRVSFGGDEKEVRESQRGKFQAQLLHLSLSILRCKRLRLQYGTF